MKIWIDFINSPQVSFFGPFINDLGAEGHSFILTCRNSANTIDLIKQRGWDYTIIGNNVKKRTISKALSFPKRIYSLISYLRKKEIDVAICQSSFYLPLAAKLMGVPSIYTNDNEHAIGNIPAFLFATKIFIPENLSLKDTLVNKWSKKKVSKYPGVKEGLYLWGKGMEIQRKRKKRKGKNKRIYYRPEPFAAQYYSGKNNFLDKVLKEIKEDYPITILSRSKSQLIHYKKTEFSGIDVPEKPLPFVEIAEKSLLFIGAGGSMTREMALMGIPTISVYQGDLLSVDKYLIAQGLMIYHQQLKSKEVEELILSNKEEKENVNLILKGKKAYRQFKTEILKYNCK